MAPCGPCRKRISVSSAKSFHSYSDSDSVAGRAADPVHDTDSDSDSGPPPALRPNGGRWSHHKPLPVLPSELSRGVEDPSASEAPAPASAKTWVRNEPVRTRSQCELSIAFCDRAGCGLHSIARWSHSWFAEDGDHLGIGPGLGLRMPGPQRAWSGARPHNERVAASVHCLIH